MPKFKLDFKEVNIQFRNQTIAHLWFFFYDPRKMEPTKKKQIKWKKQT